MDEKQLDVKYLVLSYMRCGTISKKNVKERA
jgi:hypothetical protein